MFHSLSLASAQDKSSPFDIRGTVKLIVLVGAIATIIYKLVEGNSTKKPARKAKFTVVDTPAVSGEFAAEFLAKINVRFTLRCIVPIS